MKTYSIKTTKAFFEGWKIAVTNEAGKTAYFLAEYSHELKVWNLFELDEDGDIYGNKVWVTDYPRVKHAKEALRNDEVHIIAFEGA